MPMTIVGTIPYRSANSYEDERGRKFAFLFDNFCFDIDGRHDTEVKIFRNHDPKVTYATTADGSVALTEYADRLEWMARFPTDTPEREKMADEIVMGQWRCSPGFTSLRIRWRIRCDALCADIVTGRLTEISLTKTPAIEATRVELSPKMFPRHAPKVAAKLQVPDGKPATIREMLALAGDFLEEESGDLESRLSDDTFSLSDRKRWLNAIEKLVMLDQLGTKLGV